MIEDTNFFDYLVFPEKLKNEITKCPSIELKKGVARKWMGSFMNAITFGKIEEKESTISASNYGWSHITTKYNFSTRQKQLLLLSAMIINQACLDIYEIEDLIPDSTLNIALGSAAGSYMHEFDLNDSASYDPSFKKSDLFIKKDAYETPMFLYNLWVIRNFIRSGDITSGDPNVAFGQCSQALKLHDPRLPEDIPAAKWCQATSDLAEYASIVSENEVCLIFGERCLNLKAQLSNDRYIKWQMLENIAASSKAKEQIPKQVSFYSELKKDELHEKEKETGNKMDAMRDYLLKETSLLTELPPSQSQRAIIFAECYSLGLVKTSIVYYLWWLTFEGVPMPGPATSNLLNTIPTRLMYQVRGMSAQSSIEQILYALIPEDITGGNSKPMSKNYKRFIENLIKHLRFLPESSTLPALETEVLKDGQLSHDALIFSKLNQLIKDIQTSHSDVSKLYSKELGSLEPVADRMLIDFEVTLMKAIQAHHQAHFEDALRLIQQFREDYKPIENELEITFNDNSGNEAIELIVKKFSEQYKVKGNSKLKLKDIIKLFTAACDELGAYVKLGLLFNDDDADFSNQNIELSAREVDLLLSEDGLIYPTVEDLERVATFFFKRKEYERAKQVLLQYVSKIQSENHCDYGLVYLGTVYLFLATLHLAVFRFFNNDMSAFIFRDVFRIDGMSPSDFKEIVSASKGLMESIYLAPEPLSIIRKVKSTLISLEEFPFLYFLTGLFFGLAMRYGDTYLIYSYKEFGIGSILLALPSKFTIYDDDDARVCAFMKKLEPIERIAIKEPELLPEIVYMLSKSSMVHLDDRVCSAMGLCQAFSLIGEHKETAKYFLMSLSLGSSLTYAMGQGTPMEKTLCRLFFVALNAFKHYGGAILAANLFQLHPDFDYQQACVHLASCPRDPIGEKYIKFLINPNYLEFLSSNVWQDDQEVQRLLMDQVAAYGSTVQHNANMFTNLRYAFLFQLEKDLCSIN